MIKTKSDQEMGASLKSITKAVSRCTKAKQLYFATRALASSGDFDEDEGLISASCALLENLRAEADRLQELVGALVGAIEAEPSEDVCETIQMALSEGRED